MSFSMEKVIALNTPIRDNDRKSVSAPSQRVNFDAFGAKEIRDVLKSKAHCLRAGFPSNHAIIATLNEIRDHYVLRVGLPTYLSQMLGDMATVQIQYCQLYSEDGRQLALKLDGFHDQSIQKFIIKQFRSNSLPFRVEVRKESNPERVEVRYL